MAEVHILITENLKNFAVPTGYILILNVEQAKQTDLEKAAEHLFNKKQ
ncbi:hypothetical protein [Aneurinibacillus tyrosinisolvens]|nr:hypothetical protein [Aneurinibacillus tyrosinisolvens]